MLGFQAIRDGSNHDQRHRACGEDSETSVQNRKANRQTQNGSRDLGGYSGCLTSSLLLHILSAALRQSLHQSPRDLAVYLSRGSFTLPVARLVQATKLGA